MAQARKNADWDLNDWSWDGHLFLATHLNASPSNCGNIQHIPSPVVYGPPNRSLTCSGESEPGSSDRGRAEPEKRSREKVAVEEEEEPDDFVGSLTLKLGGQVFPVTEPRGPADWDAKNGKRSKTQTGSLARAVCQVEGCDADMSEAKDYHRRHKVCEMHAKASKTIVGNVQQRFCQQCSRFHLLEEFDEGKRSCRRRLAGHNRRRRKSQSDNAISGNSQLDDHANSYLLISLLRILTNLQSGGSEQLKEQKFLTHLLKSIASLSGSADQSKLIGNFQLTQGRQNLGAVAGTSEPVHGVPCSQPASSELVQVVNPAERNGFSSMKQILPDTEGIGTRSFDLNDVCSDEHENGDQEPEHFIHESQHQDLPWAGKKYDKNIPSQESIFLDPASTQSLFSSNRHIQGNLFSQSHSRTDRIVFKLFGKDPSDFPLALRRQILDWLSNSPADIEGYIRPGCLILTIYLCLTESSWDELSHNLKPSLEKLLAMTSNDEFWQSGWVYARIKDRIAFILNGRVVLETLAFFDPLNQCEILSISPLAIPPSERVRFTVKGLNLTQSTRLLCAFDGKYLAQELTQALPICEDNGTTERQRIQCIHFSCSVPSGTGRGFVEVEDNTMRSSLFPFIVAEEAVSAEICTLEGIVNPDLNGQLSGSEERKQALDFLHEIGWLLRKAHLKSEAGFYPLVRFRFLMDFSIDQNWSAVVKKLLDILFDGDVAVDCNSNSLELALAEMSILHRAVQKNRRSTVKVLLSYVSGGESKRENSEAGCHGRSFLFRPDVVGPFDVTPLHIAASRADAEGMLDALTDDPGEVGIKAWSSARDSSGFTPEDYARLQGYESYIQLVQNKTKKNKNINQGFHAVDIPPMKTSPLAAAAPFCVEKKIDEALPTAVAAFCKEKTRGEALAAQSCVVCLAQWQRRRRWGWVAGCSRNREIFGYRPMVLIMVGIAAVCICVGVLLHTPPEVFPIRKPFRWELLDSGYI